VYGANCAPATRLVFFFHNARDGDTASLRKLSSPFSSYLEYNGCTEDEHMDCIHYYTFQRVLPRAPLLTPHTLVNFRHIKCCLLAK